MINYASAGEPVSHRGPAIASRGIAAGGRAVDALLRRDCRRPTSVRRIRNIVVVPIRIAARRPSPPMASSMPTARTPSRYLEPLTSEATSASPTNEASLKHDTALVRAHDGTPRHVDIFGYFYRHRHRRADRGRFGISMRADDQSSTESWPRRWARGACHRARIRATRSLCATRRPVSEAAAATTSWRAAELASPSSANAGPGR